MKFAVAPAEAGTKVPPHPLEGPMPPEGAFWIADQYTLRLLADGVIRRRDDDSDEAALERMQPRKPEPPVQPQAPEPASPVQADQPQASTPQADAAQAGRRLPARTDTPAAAPAPKEA